MLNGADCSGSNRRQGSPVLQEVWNLLPNSELSLSENLDQVLNACTTLSFLILKSCNGVGDELDFWPQEWSNGTVVVYGNSCSQRMAQQQPCEPLENHQKF